MATLACAPAVQAAGALLSPSGPLAARLQGLTSEERDIVETVARCSRMSVDQFSVQEVNLMLNQARFMGEL
ncbi:MAG: hypothetical protein C5B58_10285 [Acidobacteria bacterium]|nr:MAG: hypothetical protein C5B58_10285 [Acidobacteriota bacterium]